MEAKVEQLGAEIAAARAEKDSEVRKGESAVEKLRAELDGVRGELESKVEALE